MYPGGFWGPRVWDWAHVLEPEHSAEVWVSGAQTLWPRAGSTEKEPGLPMTVAPLPQPAVARGEPGPGMQSLQRKERGFWGGQSPARLGLTQGTECHHPRATASSRLGHESLGADLAQPQNPAQRRGWCQNCLSWLGGPGTSFPGRMPCTRGVTHSPDNRSHPLPP